MQSDLAARLRSPRFLLGVALLAVLGYVGLRPVYARFLFVDRTPWATMLASFPDRRTPEYPALLAHAADLIPAGSTVAVVGPTLEWHRGYSYAYFRAQYFLPGRTIIPLGWPTGPQPERLQEAEWVIGLGEAQPDGAWTVIAESSGGRVLRRAQ